MPTFTVPTIRMKVGDRLPVALFPLLYADGTAIDLTDATGIEFAFRERSATTNLTLAGTGTFYGARTTGMVQFAWGADDTEQDAGCYILSARATFPTAKTLTTPGQGFVVVYLEATIF